MTGPGGAVDLLPFACTRLRCGWQAIVALLEAMDEESIRWRPREGAWSALEIVNHLADEEREDFRERLRRTLEEPDRPWEPIDPAGWVTTRRYGHRKVRASIDRFSVEREASLRWLRQLEAADWTLAYLHPNLGPIRAGDLLVAWVAHDLFHLRQLVRLQYRHLEGAFPPFDPAYAGEWGDR